MNTVMMSIDDEAGVMGCPSHSHVATRRGDGWEISWLPGRRVDRNQAITAMTVAYFWANPPVDAAEGRKMALFLTNWCAELELTLTEAYRLLTAATPNAQPATGNVADAPSDGNA